MIVLRPMTVAAANECDEGEDERGLWLLSLSSLSLFTQTLFSSLLSRRSFNCVPFLCV